MMAGNNRHNENTFLKMIPNFAKALTGSKIRNSHTSFGKVSNDSKLCQSSNKQQNLKCINQLWQSFRRFQLCQSSQTSSKI